MNKQTNKKESNLLVYFYMIDKIKLDSDQAAAIYLDKFDSEQSKKAIIKILRKTNKLN